MGPSGTRSGVSRWVINAAILLAFSFALSSCSSAASALSATATPGSGPDVQIIHVSIVDTHDKPIQGATVRVPGTEQLDDDDYEGYWLMYCIDKQTITASAPGYQDASIPCNGVDREYRIILQDMKDDPSYSWRSARADCAECHAGSPNTSLDELSEWSLSGHARKNDNEPDYLRAMYEGAGSNGQAAAPGFRLDHPNEYGNCAYCHFPAAVEPSHQVVDLFRFLPPTDDARGEGITCDVCHKVTSLKLDDDSYPYGDQPGVLSFEFARSQSNPSLMIGPYFNPQISSGSPPSITCSPVFSESEFCAVCHYGKFYNQTIYNSYGEWRNSPYQQKYLLSASNQIIGENPDYRSCQDCHMLFMDPDGPPQPSDHDACTNTDRQWINFNHDMLRHGRGVKNPDQEIPTLIENSASVSLEPRKENGQIKVKVTITNVGAGHKLPTDSPLRQLILVVEAQDWNESNLLQAGGPMIPLWAADDFAGKPGKVFANVLKNKDTNLAPAFDYWNPVEPAWDGADTRIDPRASDVSEYSFAAPDNGTTKITVKLYYRKVYKALADAKGWQVKDILINDAIVEVP